ncbi:protein phosphatase 2C domain-containing protein [Saccharopolyspora tripterygii]
MASTLLSGSATHVGGRKNNQDSVLVSEGLFAVADGIGGFVNGDVASRLALDTLESAFATDRTAAGLLESARKANEAVWLRSNADSTSMGTTLVAVAMTSDAGTVAINVGDSRLYRLRDGSLEQLTRDHTVLAELLRSREVSDADARNHPHRHVLTRAVGVGPEVEIDLDELTSEPGDRLLLCSDGLFNAKSAEDIERLLGSDGDPQDLCDGLVEAALEADADDNVTALVLEMQ